MTAVKREQCPECVKSGDDLSGNNLVTFQNGTKFCFACNMDTSQLEGIPELITTTINPDLESGIYHELERRGISLETCVKYGYMINRDNGTHIANVFDGAGNIVYQKIRRVQDKSFYSCGDKNYSHTLYGQHLFTPNPKVFITVTEGEIDCLSVFEAFKGEFDTPVVSTLQGAASAEKTIKKNLEYLQGFKYVVLAFDNDKAGREATEAALKYFEPGKVRTVKWPQKDASDLLQKGDGDTIRKLIWRAKEYMPEPIKTEDALMETLEGYKTKTRDWPWSRANRVIAPIHIPAVYTIAAKPAIGKTLFVSELMRDVINSGGKVGIVALEETIQKVLLKMASAFNNVDLLSIHNRELTDEEKGMCRAVAKNIVIYDHITYGSDIATICNNIPYMVRSCGCDLIIFDNLSYSATGLSGNERVGIDKAMVQLKDSTVKYEYTLLNVCHMKRDDEEEFVPMTAEKIRGSGGVEMYSDYIIGLDRDRTADDSTVRNTLSVHVLKDRMSGQDTGKVFNLYYNKEEGRLQDGKEII
jgi:twinkle protein